MKVDLARGYLFRPTTRKGGIADAPLSAAATEAPLKIYLQEMGADDGETLYGFRAGCAITLALKRAHKAPYGLVLFAAAKSSKPRWVFC